MLYHITLISSILFLLSSCASTPTASSPTPAAANTKTTSITSPPPIYLDKTPQTLKGDINCRQGDSNCNICANNVERQFNTARQGQLTWKQKPWRFNWDKPYPPYQRTSTSLFNDSKKNWVGIPDHHVQGFIRTNSTRYPYAGSHSHAKKGGIFIIEQTPDGKKYLRVLHQSQHRHPSGVQVLGKYLLFGDGKDLRLINVDSPLSTQNIQYELPTKGLSKPDYRNFGGGVGMTHLANGDYLILSSVPGAQDNRPRFHRFYTLTGKLEQPTSIKLLSESRAKNPTGWAKKFTYSENLSLITECRTGTIYAIHTTGDETGINALVGNGYWRLSKLTGTQQRPQLTPLQGWKSSQNITDCHLRSTGTVYVNQQHKMEFYCHGYAKNKSRSGQEDKFYFKVAQ